MSATTVTATTTATPVVDVTTTTTTTTPPAAPVKAKRKTGGGRKKKVVAAEAPATTIAPPVAAATVPAATTTKPKIPRISAHSLFASERKPKLKAEHPTAKANEIVKLLSAEWKALEGEMRADYEKRAAEQKRQVEAKEKAEAEKVAAAAAAAAAAAEAEASGKKKKGGKKRKAKDGETGTTEKVKRVSNGIKRPMSAYMYFTKHFKFDKPDAAAAPATNGDGSADTKDGATEKKMSQSGHKMGGKWNSMTADEKKKYVDLAAEDKLRYAKEKAAYDVAHPKPPKVQTRAHSAYIIFTQERRPVIKAADEDITFKQMGVKLGEEWAVVKQDPAKKQKYIDERERQKEKYKKPTPVAAAPATTVVTSA